MTKLGALTLLTLVATTMLTFGCGADDSNDGSSALGTAPTRASVAYSQKCAGCHGPKGVSEIRVDKDAGVRPLIPPVIPGRLSLQTYMAVVREGRRPEMPAYPVTDMSDADMARDYEWLKAKP